ncbi:MAG: hypothetical protein G8345_03755 [Magnetococcales bacterium]|nr:hypothetical protein [Magnetococcales bacterium]NGZ25991.1 hypothetical protein [Magnetococcales bacterium]
MRLGIDLDNTLIFLDKLFFQTAVSWGWLSNYPEFDKTGVRLMLRHQHDGEHLWRELQAEIYGPSLHQAPMMDGAADFLHHCRWQGVQLFIVSHKTHFAGVGEDLYDIRSTAMEWLRQQGFFLPNGFGMGEEHIFFESSREEKIARIASLNLNFFVDDLPEVLTDPAFPPDVRRIWFNPSNRAPLAGIPSCRHWRDIERHVFGG